MIIFTKDVGWTDQWDLIGFIGMELFFPVHISMEKYFKTSFSFLENEKKKYVVLSLNHSSSCLIFYLFKSQFFSQYLFVHMYVIHRVECRIGRTRNKISEQHMGSFVE